MTRPARPKYQTSCSNARSYSTSCKFRGVQLEPWHSSAERCALAGSETATRCGGLATAARARERTDFHTKISRSSVSSCGATVK